MMVNSVGTMSQNPVDTGVATTVERTQLVKRSPILYTPREMTQSTQGHTVKSITTFRQQDEESNLDLKNKLTHQMATVLNSLTESNNQHFDTVNTPMNRMAKALDSNEDVKDPIV